MGKLDFSVSICVYEKDNPVWFKMAMDSVIEQTIKPTEVIVVVDGPVPDELDLVIKEYEKTEWCKVIRLEINQGHAVARKTGLSACQNELVAIMDADDICVAGRFQKQLAMFVADETIDVVGGNISEFIEETSNIVGKRIVPSTDQEIKKYMKNRCPMNMVTVMFKKSSVEAVGGFIDWYCEEDYYLWIRMALAGKRFANVEDVLVNVRVGEDMYKRRGGWRYFKSEIRLQRYMRKKRVIGALTYIVNVIKRLIVQVMLPNSLRGWVFKKFAREG